MRFKNLDGADKIRRALRQVAREGADDITAAINKSTEEIQERAEILVPRDQNDLARDIHTELVETKRGVAGLVLVGTRPETAITARVQEHGRAPGPGEHRGHPAQSFLFPAYFSVRPRVRGRIARAVRKAVRKVLASTR